MAYYINPKNLTSGFFVPSCVSDEHLKLSTHLQLKVLLCFLRNSQNGITEDAIAEQLFIPVSEVTDALDYWTKLGVLMTDTKPKAPEIKVVEPKVVRNEKPSRSDVIKRGTEDPSVAFLLREAQLKFGRSLKSNESSCLLWLYDDLGLDISVILLAIQFSLKEEKPSISKIEKLAVDWANKGITTIEEAEKEMAEIVKKRTAWSIVMSVFGIENRKPSDKETEFANCWINEWQMSRDMLKAAYNACIDANAKLSMAYINGVLKNWHKDGITKPQDIEKAAKVQKSNKQNGATYDLDLFEKMINSDD